MQLRERNWIKESIELSEMTVKRIDNDINKILYRLIKLYEDFNWLVESLATFYYYSVYKKEERKFPDNFLNDIKLPSLNSIDWFNGFEWKGLFIRIQKYSHSKNLFNEMKALNFLFFDYIQIIDNSKIGNINLLSNNIIFPLFSYSEICGMILFATPIIYYINSDNIYFEKEVFNLSNNNNENKEISKNLNNEFDNIYKEELENSEIFSRISSNNLLKINNPEYGKLPKYLVININNCIPSLFSFSSFKKYNFFSYEMNERKYYNYKPNINANNQKKLCIKDELNKIFNFSYKKNETKIIEKFYEGINFKIFYNTDDKDNIEQNTFINFLLNNDLFQNRKTSSINDLNEIKISSKCIVQYELSNEIKLRYSLIKPLKLNSEENFLNIYYAKTNFFIHFENWCKMISKSNYNINTYKGLRENMKIFGINFGMVIFCIFSIQNENIVDILKIGIFCKLLKYVFNNEDNLYLIKNLLKYENIHNSYIYKENNHKILNKKDSFEDNRKEKIFYLIKLILYPNEILPLLEEYFNFIYEQLLFIMNIKFLKWKLLDEYFLTDFFSELNDSILNNFTPKSFLCDIISVARKKPFLFLTTLEEKLNFTINPFVKFKSSISLESLYEKLLINNILIDPPYTCSYIKPNEISGYILAKCIFISDSFNQDFSKNESDENNFNFPRGKIPTNPNFVPLPNIMETKINMKEYNDLDSNLSRNSFIYNQENINNITNIKKTLHNEPGKNIKNNFVSSKDNILSWKDISNEFTIQLPSICYKQKYKFEENTKEKNFYQYLKNKYSILKFESIKDWLQNITEIFFQIYSNNFNVERTLIRSIFYTFINYYYFDNNQSELQKTLSDIKEICLNRNYKFNYQELAIINLMEGMLEENYFLSEKYFSISIMLILLSYGEPRGKNNDSHGFMMFPLWKVARKASFFEDSFINENFKEMFHALEYNEINKNSKKLNFEKQIYDFQKHVKKNIEILFMSFVQKSNKNSQINESMDIDERSFFENFLLHTEKNIQLSESNFNYENTEINSIKNFIFPQITKKKKLNAYFTSREFIIYFLKQIQSLFNDNSKTYSQTFIDQLSKDIFNPNPKKTKKNIFPKSKIDEKINNSKGKKTQFSHFIYDELLDKLSYKKNVPNGVLISFGNNIHHETTHDNIDSLTLPRLVFKLKNLTVKKIFSGWEHSIIIDSKDEIYSWGNNQSCQCGVDKKLYKTVENPINISYLNNNIKANEISCGNEYNLILTKNNEIYGFGSNDDNVLCMKDKKIKTEKLIKIPLNLQDNNDKIIQISSGTVHNIILSEKGKVYCWGSCQGGQLGLSQNYLLSLPNFQEELSIKEPTIIPNLNNIIKVVSGEAHSIALNNEGKCYSWGFGSNGQLGLGFCEDSFEPGTGMIKSRIFEPTLIENLNNNKIIDISSGKTFSMFINEKKELFSCGINDIYQCGIAEKNPIDHIYSNDNINCCDYIIPTQLEHFFSMKVVKIACGEGHCIAIVNDNSNLNTVWSWGNNRFGQLGLGGEYKKSLPKPINYLFEYDGTQFSNICCGGFHSLVLIKYKKDVEWIEKDYEKISNKIMNLNIE